MKKFFTSLIAFAVMLCAIVFASACAPTSKAAVSASVNNQTVRAATARIPIRATLRVTAVRELGIEARPLENRRPSVITTSRYTNFERLKTETRKRVNPQKTRNNYGLPPDVVAYNGIGFANLIRARPQNS